MSNRIAPRDPMAHVIEMDYFNALIVDLKLKELGKPMLRAIDMERLEEGTKHIRTLMQCRKKMLFH